MCCNEEFPPTVMNKPFSGAYLESPGDRHTTKTQTSLFLAPFSETDYKKANQLPLNFTQSTMGQTR